MACSTWAVLVVKILNSHDTGWQRGTPTTTQMPWDLLYHLLPPQVSLLDPAPVPLLIDRNNPCSTSVNWFERHSPEAPFSISVAPGLVQTSHPWTGMPTSRLSGFISPLLLLFPPRPVTSRCCPDVSLLLLQQLGLTRTACRVCILPGLLPFYVRCPIDINWRALKQNKSQCPGLPFTVRLERPAVVTVFCIYTV